MVIVLLLLLFAAAAAGGGGGGGCGGGCKLQDWDGTSQDQEVVGAFMHFPDF